MKKDNKNTKQKDNRLLITTIIFLLISIIFASTYFFKGKIESFVNATANTNTLSTTVDENGLIVHFINVGQADACLIELPTDEIMIIDTGDDSESSQELFQKYINSFEYNIEDGEKVIDYLILTHPDADHIGGATYLFNNFKIKNCYRPQVYASNETFADDDLLATQSTSSLYATVISKLKYETANSGCMAIKTAQELTIKPAEYDTADASNNANWIVNFYTPILTDLPYKKSETGTDPIANDYSPLMILSYKEKQIMFTGDASSDIEEDFINYYSDELYNDINFNVDILKIGHHGSKSSTSTEFIDFIDPEYAIISVGDNSYGHPNENMLTRLTTYGLSNYDIYRTDINGNIKVGISTDGKLSLIANNIQYTTHVWQWWEMYLIAEACLVVIIYSSYIANVFGGKKLRKLID